VANSRREKELARQRAERQAARRAAAAARRKQRQVVIASVAAVLLVVAAVTAITLLSRDDDGEDVAAPTASTAPSAPSAEPTATATGEPSADPSAEPSPEPGTCRYPSTDEPASRQAPVPPEQDVEQQQAYTATLTTSQGPIVLSLDTAGAPCTVNSFRSLAEADYFDGTTCHRLTTSGISVLQCGDPTGTGTGGPGYAFADENLEGATYPRGTVAMANAGPGTNGSQFFLVYGDTSLPPNYTPFGTVTAGLEALDTVAAGGSNPPGDGKPVIPVDIMDVQVVPAA
jgi:peptidyl-prolyl cis-trans isomerase B (cyclophilin B)